MRCKDVNWVHVVDKGTGLSPSTSVFSCQDHSSDAQNSFICTFFLLGGQMGEAWEPSKKKRSFGNRGGGGRWIEKYFQFLWFLEGQ